jgi:hypothetical protein
MVHVQHAQCCEYWARTLISIARRTANPIKPIPSRELSQGIRCIVYYRPRRFGVVFARARPLSCPEPDVSNLQRSNLFLSDPIYC